MHLGRNYSSIAEMWDRIGHVPKVEAKAVILSLSIGIILLAVKFTAYFLTQSAAIFSDATESIANVLAAAVALYSLIVAHRPADLEHPYGHGKVEFISAWFEASLILAAACFIVIKTIDAMIHGAYAGPDMAISGIVLMSAAMVVNGAVGGYLLRVGRKEGSITLIADGKHLLTDVYTTVGVLIALGLVKLTGFAIIDPIAAYVVAAYIGYVSLKLLGHAAAGIMDKQDIADQVLITRILDAHCGGSGREPRICNYHKLRVRHSGRYHWVDFHIRLPGVLDVRKAHEIATAIELEIESALGEGNATAHIEPCDERQCEPTGICGIVPGYVPPSLATANFIPATTP